MALLETWRASMMEGFEVSSHGRLRNIHTRGFRQPAWNSPTKRFFFVFCQNKQTTNISVHKMVAEAFLGACPVGLVVEHIDQDHTNNRADNLIYTTQQVNIRRAFLLSGSWVHGHIYSKKARRIIHRLSKQLEMKTHQIAKVTGLSYRTIRRILKKSSSKVGSRDLDHTRPELAACLKQLETKESK